MKILVIAAAGSASRFNKNAKKPVPKCVYYDENPKKTVLYNMFLKTESIGKIILVGGFKFDLLKNYLNNYLSGYIKKTELVFNPLFEDYGSAYSLYLGIDAAMRHKPSQIIFAEGDLFYGKEDFLKVAENENNVITANTQPIQSDKSVVFYKNTKGFYKYLYDAKHKELFIKEPFLSIYNSAQIWKFTNLKLLFNINKTLSTAQKKDTNLSIINSYFSQIPEKKVSVITMSTWVNCNTIEDYKNIWEKK